MTDVSLSTHVLDTGAGRPAAAVLVELFRGSDLVASARTNEEGRVAEVAAGLEPGRYQLVFHPPSPFFRRIALELELGAGHHHVPLLVSSFGCASYRGS